MRFDELSIEKRLMLADGANDPDALFGRRVVDINALRDAQCSPDSIIQAGVTISMLRSSGELTLNNVVALGFDAAHLTSEPNFLDQLIREFGAEHVREAFLRTQSDAVLLAGNAAASLGLRVGDLLLCCVGAPDAAAAVLQLQPLDSSVNYDTLRQTCIRATMLNAVGVTALDLMRSCHLSAAQLHSLGYTMRL